MIGSKDKTYKHEVNNFIFFIPTLKCHSSDWSIFCYVVWLKPWPNNFSDYLNCWGFTFIIKNELNLLWETDFVKLSELIKVKVLGNELHDDFFWPWACDYGLKVSELFPRQGILNISTFLCLIKLVSGLYFRFQGHLKLWTHLNIRNYAF